MKTSINSQKIFGYASIICLLFGIIVRFLLYFVYQQGLWLDESSLSLSMIDTKWKDLFFQPLTYNQATPFGFLIITKALGILIGYSEMTLRLLPFLSSIALLCVMYSIARIYCSKLGGFILMVCVIGSAPLIYYATEFKQYEGEALCSAILLLCFIRQIDFKKFLLVSGICLLFSFSCVFFIAAFCLGYAYNHKNNLFYFIRSYIWSILAFGIYFLVLYFGYIKPQAVQFFFDFHIRNNAFPPHNMLDLLLWIQDKFLPMIGEFILGGKPFVQYVFLFCFVCGLIALYKNRRDVFVAIIAFFVLYWIFAFTRLFPIVMYDGKGVGLRQSLFWSPIFIFGVALGLESIYTFLKHYQSKIINIIGTIILIYISATAIHRNIKVISNGGGQ